MLAHPVVNMAITVVPGEQASVVMVGATAAMVGRTIMDAQILTVPLCTVVAGVAALEGMVDLVGLGGIITQRELVLQAAPELLVLEVAVEAVVAAADI
jgi:hypothetical protein